MSVVYFDSAKVKDNLLAEISMFIFLNSLKQGTFGNMLIYLHSKLQKKKQQTEKSNYIFDESIFSMLN